MKLLLFLFVLAASLYAEQQKPSPAAKKKAAPKTAKKETPPPYNGPPPSAEKINGTDYRYVDKDGKAWIYRRGPITWVKVPEEDEKKSDTTGAAKTMTAEDKGDSVEFTRPVPVGGVARWTKKKTELDADEKAALEAALAKKDKQ